SRTDRPGSSRMQPRRSEHGLRPTVVDLCRTYPGVRRLRTALFVFLVKPTCRCPSFAPVIDPPRLESHCTASNRKALERSKKGCGAGARAVPIAVAERHILIAVAEQIAGHGSRSNSSFVSRARTIF